MENMKVRIFGVPLDHGAKKLGVSIGPSAIRYAGLLDALSFNNINFEDFGDLLISTTKETESIEIIRRVSEELAENIYCSLNEGFLPVILGGDHSVAIGSIAGASKYAKNLGVLWFDYHPDSNTPKTSPSGNIHGMPVAIALGHGYPELVEVCGFKPKLLPQNICIIGAHDIDEGEKKFLDEHKVKMYTLYDIDRLGIHAVMTDAFSKLKNCDRLHVSFDIDVLDPLIAPGTGIISKGGVNYREVSYIMMLLRDEKRISSFDIIELNPLLDIKNITAELCVELIISAIGGVYGDYERNYMISQKTIA